MDPLYECVLTIAFPEQLEDDMLDLLREHDDLVGGFTLLAAEGLGAGAHLHTAIERVRGRSRRRVVTLLSSHEHAGQLVARLKERVPNPEIMWWTSSLTGAGRLA